MGEKWGRWGGYWSIPGTGGCISGTVDVGGGGGKDAGFCGGVTNHLGVLRGRFVGVPAGNPSTAVRRSPSLWQGRLWREALGDGWSGAVSLMDQFGIGRAGAQCAPLQPLSDTAAFAAPCQRSSHQVSGASRGEGGRAAAAVYRKAKDGGTLSGYLYLCESNRRHRGTARLDESRAIEGAARPMVLRGERIRAVPPQKGG